MSNNNSSNSSSSNSSNSGGTLANAVNAVSAVSSYIFNAVTGQNFDNSNNDNSNSSNSSNSRKKPREEDDEVKTYKARVAEAVRLGDLGEPYASFDTEKGKEYFCACSYSTESKEAMIYHVESMNMKCSKLGPEDISGWAKKMIKTVPHLDNAQKAVYSMGKSNGMFLTVNLKQDYDKKQVQEAISSIPVLMDSLNTEHKSDLLVVVGVSAALWNRFDKEPPKDLKSFTEIKSKQGDVVFPSNGSDILIFSKCSRADLCYESTKQFLIKLEGSYKDFDRKSSFCYLPTTKFRPNMPRDISGFVDGSRNPDHLLRAIIDQALIFPRDDGGRHVGGSYMYAGVFQHNLQKLRVMEKTERNEVVGRNFDVVSAHQGYDNRAENPRLDVDEYHSKRVRDGGPSPNAYHTNRAHGAMYRQAMPFVEGDKEGLYFISFTRTISEFDNSLKRMAGLFQPDGSLDNIFKMTKAITSGYYYVPSLSELKELPKAEYLTTITMPVPEATVEKKHKIVAEFCTNCGYKTIFLEKKKVLESLSPEIQIIENPQNPRLAAFELYTPDGKVLFSKLALKDGMNNYPHCFPTNQQLIVKVKEIFGIDGDNSSYNSTDKSKWGMTGWN